MERNQRGLVVRDQLTKLYRPWFSARSGYVASWRGGSGAIKIGGSPFKMLAEAEAACNTMLEYLSKN
jgi:hypothetical protein